MTLKDALIYVLPLLGWWMLTGIINLAFGYKSQIEAWAESKPRIAGLLKLSRSLGFDPWNALAALLLIAKKKLPDAQKADSAVAKVEQRKADRRRLGLVDPPPMPLLMLMCFAVLLLLGCSREPQPCSAEDLARGPLALHNAECAARRQLHFPNMPDETCEATPGCQAIVAECDRWTEERCR
jgi:hypothetical protein